LTIVGHPFIFTISTKINREVILDLIKELETTMLEYSFSADAMSKFIGCSARQVSRWLSGESKPTRAYQALIEKGIKKVKSL